MNTSVQREAVTLNMLGGFFVLLGLLVLVGVFWSLDNFRGAAVSLGSGFVLVLVGLAMLFASRRLSHQRAPATPDGRR